MQKPWDDVLEYWIGSEPLANASKWFRGGPEVDEAIRERFGALREAAVRGDLEGWREDPQGAVAYVILLDQFSRNLFRGSPEAFAGDALALQAALDADARGFDRQLPPFHRAFLYMPYMHAEDLALQDRCLAAFGRLVEESPPEVRKFIQANLDYAVKHRDIIVRFGRYPHRNATLGRASTPEELAFLQQPGSSF